uniref:Cell division protein FtsL n=1 Tax=candidate division WOR-3 bacterium TaxID=2052148 RepID=A0A7V0Z578_UNCW3
MRFLLIFLLGILYLFGLVYIESELVKFNIRKENLKNQVQELKNEKANLMAKVASLSNLARIEAEAKKHDFIFPAKDDILGVIK